MKTKEKKATKCKKCNGATNNTVEWDNGYKIFICWRCGRVDKQRKN